MVLTSGWRGVQDYLLKALSAEASRDPLAVRDTLVLVPTAAAAHLLQTGLEPRFLEHREAAVLPTLSTMRRLLAELTERSLGRVRVADSILRDALMEKSLQEASETGTPPPFQLRGGLASRLLDFLDHLHATGHRFEDFAARALEEFDVPDDVGAERMAAQTRFLHEAVRRYREKLRALELEDNASLRPALTDRGPPFPYRRVLALGPDTLWPTDITFLISQTGLQSVEVVVPESMAATWGLRTLEEATRFEKRRHFVRDEAPSLWCPDGDRPSELSWVARDREEVLVGVAKLLKARAAKGRLPPVERIGVVVPSPLPYLYLAKKTLGDSGIPYQLQDDYPLATEPYVAAVNLVLDYVDEDARLPAALGLLQNPFFRFKGVDANAVTALGRELSRRRERGGTRAWRLMAQRWRRRPLQRALPGLEDREQTQVAQPALEALVRSGHHLQPLADDGTAVTAKIGALRSFLDTFGRPLPTLEDAERHERARGALAGLFERLSEAARRTGNPACPFHSFREKLHRAIESHTFSVRRGGGGVQIVDARSAGFGSFDLVFAVGLNEGEWPARSERNIFYPQWLLRDYGWPTDADALNLERRRFVELLGLPSRFVAVARHLLEEDVPTVASAFLEEVETLTRGKREALSSAELGRWLVSRPEALRAGAIPVQDRVREGRPAGLIREKLFDPEPVSATGFELYLRCPFKHYARYVLGVEEEEDLEESLTPMERGRILHDILQTGFQKWDAHETGPRPVTSENFEEALELFNSVANEKLPPEKRRIELTRLFGGPGEPGAIEWLLRGEIGRGRLRRRLLEYGFQREYRFDGGLDGESSWQVRIKGRADRVDIDSQGHVHVFDYKSGRAPDPRLTIQVPLYALCLAQELGSRPAEAAYLSLRDKKSVERRDYSGALERVREVYREILKGSFPPRPYRPHLCDTCGYVGVCRKEIASEES